MSATEFEPHKFVLVLTEPDVTYEHSLVLNHWEDLRLMHIKPDSPIDNDTAMHLISQLSDFFASQGFDPPPTMFFGEAFSMDLYVLKQEVVKDPNQLELPL